MKTKVFNVILSSIILTLISCAFGRQIPYENMKVKVNYSGSKTISLSVWDQREMVLDQSRQPDFVGYTRSGVGIAYPMGTKSGKYFADVIQQVISESLTSENFQVINIPTSYSYSFDTIMNKFITTPTDLLIVLKIKKLHTDYYAGTFFYYDVDLIAYDKAGNILVNQNHKKVSNIGGNSMGAGKYKEYSPKYLETEIQTWLNDTQIADIIK